MDLYARLLKEKEEEEQRIGRSLGHLHGLDSSALNRLLANAPEGQPNYSSDLQKLHKYVYKGVHSTGVGLRFMNLKKKYPKEYSELKGEARGQDTII